MERLIKSAKDLILKDLSVKIGGDAFILSGLFIPPKIEKITLVKVNLYSSISRVYFNVYGGYLFSIDVRNREISDSDIYRKPASAKIIGLRITTKNLFTAFFPDLKYFGNYNYNPNVTIWIHN